MVQPTPVRLQQRAGFLMHKAGQRALILVNDSLAELGIDVRQYSVLCVLAGEPCSQTDLCEALRVDRTTMVQLIDGLESLKLVQRTVNQEDRRAHVVLLNDAGRRALAKADGLVADADKEFLAVLKRSERAQLISLLSKLA